MKSGISAFLVAQFASASADNAQLPILKDQGFIDRVFSVCEYLLLETLEIANNSRRDSYLPSVLPRNIRWAVSGDRELTEVFHIKEAMEFYYPLHEEVAAEETDS